MLKEYFESVIMLVLFAALVLGVVHTRLKDVTYFSTGVLVICAIMLPLVSIIRDIDHKYSLDDIFHTMEYEDLTDGAIESAFEMGISGYVANKYGVDSDDVLVMADGFDLERMRAQRIYITLSSKAVFLDYKKIEEEIEKEFTDGGECEVSLKIG